MALKNRMTLRVTRRAFSLEMEIPAFLHFLHSHYLWNRKGQGVT
jgi:hypothetical protein